MNPTPEEIASVKETYKKELVVPDKNKIPVHQFFLGTVGLVGAGKSTVLKPLSEKFSLIRISSDEIRRILKLKDIGYESLMEILKPISIEFAQEGYSLAFDADCGNPRTKEYIEQLAQKVGAKIFWLNVNTPEDFILHKLRTYKHTWLFKDGEDAVNNYLAQKKTRQEAGTHFDFLTAIDTSRLDLPEQIEKTYQLIKESSLN